MTTTEAKRIVRTVLDSHGFTNRVTARTVDFTDLARARPVFVTVHDALPAEGWTELEAAAREHGFVVTE